ncbi:hypothetical protein TNCV_4359831 [Trichonephila clavipes]|uniref:Uncharacterized protein n=1 Tax=Trichonephila clavipes TaxID=2585209 RepID=A0A8X6WBH5_TRICX|nr:hypothetical protein TNCV_4359831 [Trichonephila clavipes]
MADCEVEGAIASSRSYPPADSFERKREGNVPNGKRSSERRNLRTREYVGPTREADAYRQSRYISLKIMKAN